ncbi:MAG: TatD family hydrolase [Lachnospiraceae bacterium]|nr:TatD family hydrolase [Lachnospiraceae bacterium]
MIFETHAHYDDDRFAGDKDELLSAGLKAVGVDKVMNVAADIGSVETTNELSLKYDNVYAALGIHPSEVKGLEEKDMVHIKALAEKNKKVRAIGEIGFDYHYEDHDRDKQEKWFVRQIELAKELSLPIIVHSRDAAADTMRVIKAYYTGNEPGINGVIHCFSYSAEEALKYIKLGFMIGVGGVVTYKNGKKLKEVVEKIPLDSIVLETDSPYLAPEPHRGERNSSLNLPYIVSAIAAIKGISDEETERITYDNAMRLYALA